MVFDRARRVLPDPQPLEIAARVGAQASRVVRVTQGQLGLELTASRHRFSQESYWRAKECDAPALLGSRWRSRVVTSECRASGTGKLGVEPSIRARECGLDLLTQDLAKPSRTAEVDVAAIAHVSANSGSVIRLSV